MYNYIKSSFLFLAATDYHQPARMVQSACGTWESQSSATDSPRVLNQLLPGVILASGLQQSAWLKIGWYVAMIIMFADSHEVIQFMILWITGVWWWTSFIIVPFALNDSESSPPRGRPEWHQLRHVWRWKHYRRYGHRLCLPPALLRGHHRSNAHKPSQSLLHGCSKNQEQGMLQIFFVITPSLCTGC